MKKILLTAIILIASILNVSANETNLKIQNLENKISNLEKQLDNYNQLHSDYKDIIYWVLWIIAWGFLFNWFKSYKLWEKEIQNIKEELKNYIISENNNNIHELKTEFNKTLNIKLDSKLRWIYNHIHELEHELFMNKKINFIHEFKDKLDNDIKINEYKIDDTLDKLQNHIKDNALRINEKIELKDILENIILKMEKINNSVLEADIITCKTIIKQHLWELD